MQTSVKLLTLDTPAKKSLLSLFTGQIGAETKNKNQLSTTPIPLSTHQFSDFFQEVKSTCLGSNVTAIRTPPGTAHSPFTYSSSLTWGNSHLVTARPYPGARLWPTQHAAWAQHLGPPGRGALKTARSLHPLRAPSARRGRAGPSSPAGKGPESAAGTSRRSSERPSSPRPRPGLRPAPRTPAAAPRGPWGRVSEPPNRPPGPLHGRAATGAAAGPPRADRRDPSLPVPRRRGRSTSEPPPPQGPLPPGP